jgi:hypothetical protein
MYSSVNFFFFNFSHTLEFLENPNGEVSKFSKYHFFFKRNCKDLGVGQDLIEFAKIPARKSFFLFSFFKKMYLRIFTRFNGKS